MDIEEEKEQNKSTEYVQNKETVNNTATKQPNERFQKESYVMENNVLIKGAFRFLTPSRNIYPTPFR